MALRRSLLTLPVACVVIGAGCSGAPPDEAQAEVAQMGEVGLAIINGTPDTTRDAVVAVRHGQSWCSGTIVAQEGNVGYVLSAAHCVNAGNAEVVIGDNYATQAAVDFDIIESVKHPYYNQSVYDFAMISFYAPGVTLPVIPPVTPQTESLSPGTPIRWVGYGETASGNNSVRRQLPGTLDEVTALTLEYNQASGGPCSGDSGGALLTTGTERLAGVIANTQAPSEDDLDSCTFRGASGRVSVVHESFVQAYIDDGAISAQATAPQTCDQCFQWSTTGNGPCASAISQCFENSPQCLAFLACIDPCTTFNCQVQCAEDHALGYQTYLGIYDCACDTHCPTQCASDTLCNFDLTPPMTAAAATGAAATATTTTTGVGGAGAATAAVGTGVGGAAPGDGWVAGDLEDRDYEGTLRTTAACGAAGRGAPAGAPVWLAAALVALGLRRRRAAESSMVPRRRRVAAQTKPG